MTRIESLDADAFRPLVATAAHIYGMAMRRGPELVVQRREIMTSHLARRGFRCVVALDDGDNDDEPGELAGFGYGYRGRPGEWWHDIVSEAVGRDAARRWMTDAFELAELHVRPGRQGEGLGRRIAERLVAEAGTRTMVLSTHDVESPARSLYRSLGFVDIECGFVFPGGIEVYAIMARVLSDRSA